LLSNYEAFVQEVLGELLGNLDKREIYARLCRANSLDRGTMVLFFLVKIYIYKKKLQPLALPQKNLQKNLYLDPSLSNFLDPSLLIGINFLTDNYRLRLISIIDNRLMCPPLITSMH
jgi:hypothetical protein